MSGLLLRFVQYCVWSSFLVHRGLEAGPLRASCGSSGSFGTDGLWGGPSRLVLAYPSHGAIKSMWLYVSISKISPQNIESYEQLLWTLRYLSLRLIIVDNIQMGSYWQRPAEDISCKAAAWGPQWARWAYTETFHLAATTRRQLLVRGQFKEPGFCLLCSQLSSC